MLNSIVPALREGEQLVWAEEREWWNGEGFFLEASLRRTVNGEVRGGHGFHQQGKLPLLVEVSDGKLAVQSLHAELRPLKARGSRKETATTTEVRAVLDRIRGRGPEASPATDS